MKKYSIKILSCLCWLLALTGLTIFLSGCKKLEPERILRVTVDTLTNVGCTEFTAHGTVWDVGNNEVNQPGFCWATSENPTLGDDHNQLGELDSDGSFSVVIEGLEMNTTYYVRAYAELTDDVVYSTQKTVTTAICDLPVVTTTSISAINDLTVQCGGNITSDGGSAIVARGFCWDTQPDPVLSDNSSEEGGGSGEFSGNIGDLLPDQQYYVRAYATSEAGTAYGDELNFAIRISIDWESSFGSEDLERAQSIVQTSDGGYLIAGWNSSDGGQVSGNHGGKDFWIVKTTASGEFDWQRSFGGSAGEFAYSLGKTQDGGYIIAGESASNDGDVDANHGSSDYWVTKISQSGNIVWESALGGSDYDLAYAVDQTADGGYIVAGGILSDDHDVTDNAGSGDYWIVKLTSVGFIDWETSLGGSNFDYAYDIEPTSDGGYIVAGATFSNDGDISHFFGEIDYWVVKLDEDGELEWENCYGGSGSDAATSVCQTSDGGYIVAGGVASDNGDIDDNNGGTDYWIVKLLSNGEIDWERSLGGSGTDIAYDIAETPEGHFIIAGSSNSNNGDVSGNNGGNDYWIVKLDSEGELLWQKSLGGSVLDVAKAILYSTDGRCVIAGECESDDGDVSDSKGGADFWVVKLGWNLEE